MTRVAEPHVSHNEILNPVNNTLVFSSEYNIDLQSSATVSRLSETLVTYDLIESLEQIDIASPSIGTENSLKLYFFINTRHILESGSINKDAFMKFYSLCQKVDRLDIFSCFLKSALVCDPARFDTYFMLVHVELRLSRPATAARMLRRFGCVRAKAAATRQVLELQARVLAAAGPSMDERTRRGLFAATARTVGGTEAVEALARRLPEAGARQSRIEHVRELAGLASAIGRGDLARDILQLHRSGPMARTREFWDQVKLVQNSGFALAEGFYPFSIHLESVNACNAACVMCPVSTTARRRKRMSEDLVDKVIEEIRAFPFRPTIGLHGVGEPLLHKDLAERVARFTKAGIHVYFSTNGQLMTERRATDLLEAGLPSIIFSLETLDAAVFEATRIGLSFDVVLNNIKNFLKLRDNMGAKTSVQITLVRAPEAEQRILADIDAIRSLLSPSDELHLIPRHNFTGGYAEGGTTGSPCNHPFVQLNMTSDGLVTACCLDSEQVFVAGDLNTQSMLEIYNGPAFRELRRKHIEGHRREVDVCRECTGPEAWLRESVFPGTAAKLAPPGTPTDAPGHVPGP